MHQDAHIPLIHSRSLINDRQKEAEQVSKARGDVEQDPSMSMPNSPSFR